MQITHPCHTTKETKLYGLEDNNALVNYVIIHIEYLQQKDLDIEQLDYYATANM